ncbi:MAG: hypothetical protein VYA90_02350, partial [Acidobacteriota bacterium]|nr:hypothetical protein [Acidobacteriota bacterium]
MTWLTGVHRMEKLRIIVGFGIALVWLGSVAVHGQGAQAVEEDQTPDSKVETKVIEQAIEEASEEGREQEQDELERRVD